MILPFAVGVSRAGLAAIKEILQSHKVDVVITREIREIAFHTLRQLVP